MNHSLVTPNASTLKTQPVQVVPTNPVEPPSTWMQYGTSPTEILLAAAIVTVANTGLIGAIALLLQVLVPVMKPTLSEPTKKLPLEQEQP